MKELKKRSNTAIMTILLTHIVNLEVLVMITVSICEDEVYFMSELNKLMDKYCDSRKIHASIVTFLDGEKLLASSQMSDIILMDIKLPGNNGMEIVLHLRERGSDSQVIFITAFQKYVFQAFDLDAVHYILKPVSEEKLFSALDKAIKRIASNNGETLLITNGTSASRVPLKDILYCEAMNHQITVHTLTEQIQFFGTLDAMQEKLDDRFFRCHRSYIVNMNHVIDKRLGSAIMEGGDYILIARRKQQEFTKRMLEICRKGLI